MSKFTVVEVIHRPTPRADWRFSYVWSGNHKFTFSVAASYAADMDAARADTGEDDEPYNLPNNVTLISRSHQGDYSTEIRMTRDAAEQLLDLLNKALTWDGR